MQHMVQPPAWFFPRILVGAGAMLTPDFVRHHEISHVINCAYPEDSPRWFQTFNRTRYCCLNAADSHDVNILDWYPKFELMLSIFLRDFGSRTVFVHCQCGINRSAYLALTYIAKNFHFNYDETFRALKRQRPCMFSNQVFRKQTEEFVNGCLQSEKSQGVQRRNDGDS